MIAGSSIKELKYLKCHKYTLKREDDISYKSSRLKKILQAALRN